MKSALLGLVISVCGALFLVIVMTLGGTQMRQNELARTVDGALKSTMENQFDTKTYSADTVDEFIADFMQTLLVQINTDSSVEVKILDADQKKGLLSVEVTEHYVHPVGTEGSVSVRRSVIMEQYMIQTQQGE